MCGRRAASVSRADPCEAVPGSDAVVTEVHSREALRLGIHPGAVILRVAGYDVAGRGRGGVQEAIGLSHDSFETEFVMEIGGEAPGPAVTEEEQKAATVLQSRFRGHRVRQQAAQRQYETARAQQLGLGEGLWGGIRYEWGTDRHETLLDRLESIERRIHRQGTDALAAGGQRAARMRERAPIAAGREGSSTYWDSRTSLGLLAPLSGFLAPGLRKQPTGTGEWSQPNSLLRGSGVKSHSRPARVARRDGQVLPGEIMAAWDGSEATLARRGGELRPTGGGEAGSRATSGRHRGPRRSLSASLAALADAGERLPAT